jgi:hypothetical protein
MREFKGTTGSEVNLFKGIQRACGSYDNGIIGNQTMTELAINVGAKCFPTTQLIYKQPTIVGNDLVVFDPNGPLKNYANSMLGSFTFPRATTPCSIMVGGGKVIFNDACRAWKGYPEAVMYKHKNKIKMGEFKYASQLPNGTEWAVGGFGLLDYWNPSGQGFKVIDGKDYYNTVAYKTNHNVLGYKLGKVWGVYFKNMTATQVNAMCRDKFLFEHAIMLDGGGLAAINGAERFAQININKVQGYALQFV